MSLFNSIGIPISLPLINCLRGFTHNSHSFSPGFLTSLHKAFSQYKKALPNSHILTGRSNEETILALHYYLSLILNLNQLLDILHSEYSLNELNTNAINSTNIFNIRAILRALQTSQKEPLNQTNGQLNEANSLVFLGNGVQEPPHFSLRGFNIRLSYEETRAETSYLNISIEQLELAIHSQGRFDLYFVSSLCTELNKAFHLELHHYLISTNDPKPLFDFNLLAQHMLTKHERVPYTQDSLNQHMRIFTEEKDTSLLFQHLIKLEHTIKSTLFHCDSHAIELLKRLIICLIGHHEPKVREKAVVLLNTLSDGVDWQLDAAFKPQISTAGNNLKVSCLFEPKDACQDIFFLLSAFSFDKTDNALVVSWHQVELTPSPTNSELILATVDIGAFPRAGFYDWRFVKLNKKGEIVCLHHSILDPENNNKSDLALVQGRFIVHPRHTRDIEIHEILADYPKGIPGELYRGSFAKIAENLHHYVKSGINCLYIMGALERDHGATKNPNTGNKMFKRTDVSPTAVTCRKTVSSFLGGREEFGRLMETARENMLRIILDCVTRVSSSRPNQRYKELILQCMDEDGKLEYAYGTEGRGRKYDETIYLNYRRKEAWDLLLSETIELVEQYRIDGFNLDNAFVWGQLFEADLEELERLDTDEKEVYPLEARFYGDLIRKGKPTGYWTSEARKRFANPMLVEFCRSLWGRFPDLLLIGETFGNNREENKAELSLIKSGVVPRMYSFPAAISTLYGKRMTPDGFINDSESLGVNSLRIWYDSFRKDLPPGSIIIQSTSSYVWPHPILLFKGGAWSYIDLMFFSPHIPMTFMGETEGHAFRCRSVLMLDEAWKSEEGQYSFRNTEIWNCSGAKTSSEEFWKCQEGFNRELETSFASDMRKIETHYQQRRQLRKEMDVLKNGKMIPLTTNHSDGPYARVLTYARVTETEIAIIATNFNDHDMFIGISMKNLKFLLDGIEENKLDGCIVQVYDRIGESFEDYYTAYEFLNGNIDASIKAYGSLVWSIKLVVDDKGIHTKTLERSMGRIKNRIARNHIIEGHEVVVMLINIVKYIDNTQDFANSLLYIYKKFLAPLEIPIAELFNSIKEFQDNPELYKKLFAFCTLLKDELSHDNNEEDLALASDENNSCANVIFDEQLNVVLNSPPQSKSRSLSLSSKTSDGILGSAASKDHTLSEALAESKAEDAKTVSDLARDILKHNTLESIAFITPELGRWSTVGGLGVMVDELSVSLAQLGENVICISPYYEKNRKGESGYLTKDPDNIRYIFNVDVFIGDDEHVVGVHHGVVKGVSLYFLHQPLLFPQAYVDGDATFTMKQMTLMAKASLQIFCKLKHTPSVIVTNDWFTGLVAAYHKQGHFGKIFNKTKFIHVAHNLDPSYEGRLYPSYDEGALEKIHELPRHLLVNPQWNDLIINPSRCAILSSDQWATVSNAYRKDLLENSPLASLLRQHSKSFAISNGIIKTMRFQRILQVCENDHLKAKETLQKKYFKFPKLDNSYAIFSFVGRITHQKGVHLILESFEEILTKFQGKVQFIVGGMVHKKDSYGGYCAEMMQNLTIKYPRNLWGNPFEFFTDGTLLNAGSDFGLMPSCFEPGGIVQHEFFIGSTPVIAFQTGGLKDTVFEFDPDTEKGNGFVFQTHSVTGFVGAIKKAIDIYGKPEKYEVLRKNAYESTIDLNDVARAWNKEFYNLVHKQYIEPRSLEGNIERIEKNFKAKEHHEKLAIDWRTAMGEGSQKEGVKYNNNKGRSETKGCRFTYQTKDFPKPKSVFVVGTFNEWNKELNPLHYNHHEDRWEAVVELKPGEYFYKFVVDGHWVCAEDDPKVKDLRYNLNNYIHVVL